MTLDDVIPAPHFRERHERRVAAPPPLVWEALHDLRMVDLRLSRVLMGIRTLPTRLTRRRLPPMMSGRLLEDGPVPVLENAPPPSVVAAGAIQPWRLRGGDEPPLLDADAVRAFSEPDWVTAGLAFLLEPDGEGTRPRTETRVRATNVRTRARFGLYWFFIRAGSGLIRRDLLREVARRAEAAAQGRKLTESVAA